MKIAVISCTSNKQEDKCTEIGLNNAGKTAAEHTFNGVTFNDLTILFMENAKTAGRYFSNYC